MTIKIFQTVLSVPIVVPLNCIIWHSLLDEGSGDGMITSTKSLRVTVDNERFLYLVDVDATATWAFRLPLLCDILVSGELGVVEFLQNISVVLAVKVPTHKRHWFAIWVVACRVQSDLNVLENAIGVQVHRFNHLS